MKEVEWDDEFYVRCYQLAKTGSTNGQIASILGYSMESFRKVREERPALDKALKEAREKKGIGNFIYGKLSKEAQACWRRVMSAEKEVNSVRKIEKLFGVYGEGIKKELFLHCLAATYFNPTKACRKLGMPLREYKTWVENDFEFAQLMLEMQEHRSDFYDEAFNDLIVKREPSVVLHAQKTFNGNKGFSDKLKVEHTGEVKSTQVLELSEQLLGLLSLGAKREVMKALEQLEDQKQLTVDAL